ncbi:hypothetical protein SCUP234_01623 [Seiridium cupressi]
MEEEKSHTIMHAYFHTNAALLAPNDYPFRIFRPPSLLGAGYHSPELPGKDGASVPSASSSGFGPGPRELEARLQNFGFKQPGFCHGNLGRIMAG